MKVTLRQATHDDAGWLDTWLGQLATSVGDHVVHSAESLLHPTENDPAAHALIVEHQQSHVGLVVYTYAQDADHAIIELIATPSSEARRGYGMSAAATLEATLAARGVRRLYAPAPAAHGIAMYFWVRLGYRPLLRGEWPCERAGVAWLARQVSRTG